MRHGGRQSDRERVVFEGEESEAREHYERMTISIRQGCVRLVDGTEQTILEYRTRRQSRW